MSDDDYMLLNLATHDDGTSDRGFPSTKITGGKWKDRRRVKMAMAEKRQNKRRKVEEIAADHFSGNMKPKKPNVTNKNDNAIVSSLFTSSREISTHVNTNERDDWSEQAPSNAPLPGHSFDGLGIKGPLLSHLQGKMGIRKPTNIQKLVLSRMLSQCKDRDDDIFINAQTGSGKTLAYLLPIFMRILNMHMRVDRKSGCFAVIVAPTRELASQIYAVILMLCNCCHYLVPCLLIGGERKKSEKARLRKGCNLIVGTPGRILDHLQNTCVIQRQLSRSLRYIVLDEGDKLMELGFEETIGEILERLHSFPLDTSFFSSLPLRITHILCSATLKGNVEKLGSLTLQDYKILSDHQVESDNCTFPVNEVPDQLLQKIIIVPPKLRLVTLAASLDAISKSHKNSRHESTRRTMIFLSCSDSVEFHFQVFSSSDAHHRNMVGDSARSLTKGNKILPSFTEDHNPDTFFYKLHGSLSQQMRSATLEHFSRNDESSRGKHKIMFCTDVASRGLDLPHIGTIIEVDPPFSTEDHLHRIGRTARAGQDGEALLFLLAGEEESYLKCIERFHPKGWKLLEFDKDILQPAFQGRIVKKNDKETDSKQYENTSWDNNATTWHLNVERRILEDETFKSAAINGFTSHIRAYATHTTSEKQFFNLKCLHLGHLAKSFALRERPKCLSRSSKQNKKLSTKVDAKEKMLQMAKLAVKQSADEFNYQ